MAEEFGFLCAVCGWRYLADRCQSNVCGGNVARFERFKLELGTKLVYLKAAPDVGDHTTWLSVKLLMELHRRGLRVRSDRNHWIDAGYCLDAPEEMPAGGCYGETFEDMGEDGALASQLTVQREAA